MPKAETPPPAPEHTKTVKAQKVRIFQPAGPVRDGHLVDGMLFFTRLRNGKPVRCIASLNSPMVKFVELVD